MEDDDASVPTLDSVPPARSIPTADSIRDAYPYELHVLGPVELHLRRRKDDGSTELIRVPGIGPALQRLLARLAIHASDGDTRAQIAADLAISTALLHNHTNKLRVQMANRLFNLGGYRRHETALAEVQTWIPRHGPLHLAPGSCTTDCDIMLQLGDEATQLHAQGRDDLALRVMSEALELIRGVLLDGVKGADDSPWVATRRAEIHGCVTAMVDDAREWAQAEGWAAGECEQFAAALRRLGPSSGPR